MSAPASLRQRPAGPHRSTEPDSAPAGRSPAESVPASRTAAIDIAPLMAAVVPFAIAIGGTIAESAVTAWSALAGSVILLAGASQLAAITVHAGGAGINVAALTAVIINLRFVLYGAGMARWFRTEARWVRLLLVIPLVDQTYLLCARRFEEHHDPGWRRRYYLTATGLLAGAFVPSQFVGYLIGDAVPAGAGLHLAAPLVFGGMLAVACQTRAQAVAAAVAAVLVVVLGSLPGGLALPVAVVAGLAAGSLVPAAPSRATGDVFDGSKEHRP